MSDLPARIGRYHVERRLGEGGMGVLYLASDPVLGRAVALKLLRVDGDEMRRRFVREAQSAAALQHPNIVTIYDVGDHDGQLFIAMEYIDGDTLATLVHDRVPFSPLRKLAIIDEIADGLGFAHQRDIIHRDVKPANLMISRSGLAKILDFGIARVSKLDSGEITGTTMVGTPAYMAPELLDGHEADQRADIYALGLVMYELLTGQRAFAAATTDQVLQQVLTGRATPLSVLRPDLDPALDQIVSRAMARNLADRYQDIQSFRKDLARARRAAMLEFDEETVVAPLPVPASASRPPTPPATPPAEADPDETAVAPLVTRTQTPDDTGPVPVPLSSPPPLPMPAAPLAVAPEVDPDATVVAPIAAMAAAMASETQSHAAAAGVPPAPPPVPSAPSFSSPGPANPEPERVAASVESPVTPVTSATARAASPAESGPVPRALPSEPPPPPVPPRRTSPPRAEQVAASASAVAAAPSSLAAAGTVTAPLPGSRKGLPVGLIVAVLFVLVGGFLLAAFLVVRTIGSFAFGSRGAETEQVADAVAPEAPSADVPAAIVEEGTPSSDTTEVPNETPGPVGSVAEEAPVGEDPVSGPRPADPPVVSTPVTGEARTARRTTPAPTAAAAERATRAERATPVTTPPPARTTDTEPVRRAEAPPPKLVAPREEALGLVRGYVAARNTAHASGIRRVWPTVDDTHIRRVTSSFSAPLTLSTCEVEARTATTAVATCYLTQPGTTGAYANGQALTIRRTLVFDLVRLGNNWSIAGLRE